MSRPSPMQSAYRKPSSLLKLSIIFSVLMSMVGCSGSSGGGADGNGEDIKSEENTIQGDVRIMAVGDSITHGVPTPGPSASWRLPFTVSLDQDGCDYEMVGSQTGNEGHNAFVSAHEAYSAHEAGDFVTGRANYAGSNDGIFASMQNYAPEVVLLHIGTNDAVNLQDNQETLQEIDQIITTIVEADGVVLVANIIPTFTEEYLDGVDEQITALGLLIENHIAQLAHANVSLVDVRSGYTADMMHSDGIHPNERGSQHIADAFANTYALLGYCITGR